MGDFMYIYACKPEAVPIFYGKKKAIQALIQTSLEQQDVFFYRMNLDSLYHSMCSYYDKSMISKQENSLVIQYLTHQEKIIVNENYLEAEHIDQLIDYLQRRHPIWVIMDETGQVYWIGACKKGRNCVE